MQGKLEFFNKLSEPIENETGKILTILKPNLKKW